MQTESDFDKQQVILTKVKLFWQTGSYSDKQQVILTNSKLFWQTACYFDKQQVILTNIFNETTNELTTFANLCRHVTIFNRKELASLFQV